MKLSRSSVVLSLLCAVVMAGCQTPVKTLETKVVPDVVTLAKINIKGINPQNHNDWLSPHWPEIEAWWRALPTSQPPRAGLHAVVGWEILFDTRGGDSKFRQDLYRVGFSYDLTPHQNLKGLVTKAELTFSSAILSSGVSPNSLCQPVTGAGGSLIVLAPTATLPVAPLRMAYLGSEMAAAPYPAGSRVFAIPQGPYLSGTVAPGVTSSPTGLGTASYTVDVTTLVNAALERGATSLSFMISSSDETSPTAFPPGPQDCKTTYRVDDLVITHL